MKINKLFVLVLLSIFLIGCLDDHYEFTQYDENMNPVKTFETPPDGFRSFGMEGNTFWLKDYNYNVTYMTLPPGHTIKSVRVRK